MKALGAALPFAVSPAFGIASLLLKKKNNNNNNQPRPPVPGSGPTVVPAPDASTMTGKVGLG